MIHVTKFNYDLTNGRRTLKVEYMTHPTNTFSADINLDTISRSAVDTVHDALRDLILEGQVDEE